MEIMLTNCSVCGAQILFPENENIIECSFCRKLNERPKSSGERLEAMKRGNELRRQCRFEEAEQCYEYVLRHHPNEHEALWGRVLCKYGVEAVEERKYGQIKRYLVCHRARNTSIRNEGDFRDACRYADEAIRRQYLEEGEYIDNVQARIREIAAEKEGYEVFICYKETDLSDPRKQTADSNVARRLCNRLMKDGYRVFFAPYTLKDMTGEDYEAEIYHAINTAKVMFVLGLKKEHFNATWPRSEWLRFMESMEMRNASLKPIFGDGMHAEDLPEEFRNMGLQGMNIDDRIDYMEDLVNELYRTFRRERKVQPAPQPVPEPVPQLVPQPVPPIEFTGTPEELLEQGMLYYNDGPAQNLAKAFACFGKAAEKLPEAQRMVAECYRQGKGVNANAVQAFQQYLGAAAKGNAEAQYEVSRCYEEGDGVDKDLVQAVVWLKKAAQQNHVDAQFALGMCYENGTCMDKNMEMATKLYQKAAEQGLAQAQYCLGTCYEKGEGVGKDLRKANAWYQKAAEQGYTPAKEKLAPKKNPEPTAEEQYNLAVRYDKGDGVEKDFNRAFELYKKAADQGHAVAQYEIGQYYYHGKGVDADVDKAVMYYMMSAEQGYALAQYELGRCYEEGIGYFKSPLRAKIWYEKAMENGCNEAKDALLRIEKKDKSWVHRLFGE